MQIKRWNHKERKRGIARQYFFDSRIFIFLALLLHNSLLEIAAAHIIFVGSELTEFMELTEFFPIYRAGKQK